MGKKKAKVVEGRSRQERIAVRKSLGTLKSLTVQPTTRKRYDAALRHFYDYLARESLTLPKQRDHIDPLVSDYLEELWATGESRAEASNFLAGLQDFDPKLKHKLPGSWRLMKTWTTNEIPNRAPPLSENLIHAMVGWSRFHEHPGFGLSLLVGFYCMLRTGELLSLRARDFHMNSANSPAVIALGLTKSGKRQGAAESVTLGELPVLKALWDWKRTVPANTFLTPKPHQWRQLFNECLNGLQISSWGFRPYSLRRGGAAFFFLKHGSLDRILIQGRWTAVKTAKVYLNSGLAMLADLQIPSHKLRPYLTVYTNSFKTPSLEPVLKNRAGGRGKARKDGGRNFFCFISCSSVQPFLYLGLWGSHGVAWSQRGTREYYSFPPAWREVRVVWVPYKRWLV